MPEEWRLFISLEALHRELWNLGGLMCGGFLCANIWILFLVLFVMYCYVGATLLEGKKDGRFLSDGIGCADGPLKIFLLLQIYES